MILYSITFKHMRLFIQFTEIVDIFGTSARKDHSSLQHSGADLLAILQLSLTKSPSSTELRRKLSILITQGFCLAISYDVINMYEETNTFMASIRAKTCSMFLLVIYEHAKNNLAFLVFLA